MSKRVTNAGQSWSGPVFTNWDSSEDWAQQDRWSAYAEGRVNVQGQEPVGPLAPPDVERYRLMQLRCSQCGALIGAVWSVLNEWQGKPFTWVDTAAVEDRATRPPGVRVRQMILDAVTASFEVQSECVRHGWRAISASELMRLTPKAAERLAADHKSLAINMDTATA